MITRSLVMLVLLSVGAPASADVLFRESDLGTLFTTVKQRHQIDRLRKGKVADAPASERVSPSHIQVNGIVKSSKGGSVVWVNGRSVRGAVTRDGVKVLRARSSEKSVVMLVDGKLVRVKPGESWSENQADE